MCVSASVCLCLCVHVYVCVCLCLRACAYVPKRSCVCGVFGVHVCRCTCVCACMHVCACVHVCMHIRWIWMHVHIFEEPVISIGVFLVCFLPYFILFYFILFLAVSHWSLLILLDCWPATPGILQCLSSQCWYYSHACITSCFFCLSGFFVCLSVCLFVCLFVYIQEARSWRARLVLSPLAPKVFSTGRDDKVVERSLIKQCHLEAAAPNDSSPGPWWVAAETVI